MHLVNFVSISGSVIRIVIKINVATFILKSQTHHPDVRFLALIKTFIPV